MVTRLINHARMVAWSMRVDRIIREPPGTDDGLSAESIELDRQVRFTQASTWSIVCEEVLDTQFSRAYFERAWSELRRRGISDAELVEMRRIAWLTAGWLNYECMLWDWVNLDATDMHRALAMQFEQGWISENERQQRTEYIRKYEGATGSFD